MILPGSEPVTIAHEKARFAVRRLDAGTTSLTGEGACVGASVDRLTLVTQACRYELAGPTWWAVNACESIASSGTTLTIACPDWRPIDVVGGVLEDVGRLRYIDGCSDSLLAGPPRRGEPCLNFLHFPPQTVQSFHHHPSFRAGIVVRGSGVCDLEGSREPLTSGTVFLLPQGEKHRFQTGEESMDVVAFHPDSDTGPTDEDHPMINRTWT
jgi:mannose-6-phosphate isomerase-like protein (cupin superfamily)